MADIRRSFNKQAGEKEVFAIRYTEWLDGESIDTVEATSSDASVVTITSAQKSTTVLTIEGKSTPVGEAVLVAYVVASGATTGDRARIDVKVQSSNANRFDVESSEVRVV